MAPPNQTMTYQKTIIEELLKTTCFVFGDVEQILKFVLHQFVQGYWAVMQFLRVRSQHVAIADYSASKSLEDVLNEFVLQNLDTMRKQQVAKCLFQKPEQGPSSVEMVSHFEFQHFFCLLRGGIKNIKGQCMYHLFYLFLSIRFLWLWP